MGNSLSQAGLFSGGSVWSLPQHRRSQTLSSRQRGLSQRLERPSVTQQDSGKQSTFIKPECGFSASRCYKSPGSLENADPTPRPSSTPGPLTPQVYSGASAGAFCSGPVLKHRDEQKGARPEAGLAQGENPRTRNTEQTSPGRDRRAGTRRQRRVLTAASPAVAPPPHTAEGSVHSPGMGRILHPR